MTILRIPAIEVDKYGDPIVPDEEPEAVELVGAFVAPGGNDDAGSHGSRDITGRGRNGVTVALTLYAPYGTELHHDDKVDVDGVVYEVDGEPGQWKNPLTGWEAGIVATLLRAEG